MRRQAVQKESIELFHTILVHVMSIVEEIGLIAVQGIAEIEMGICQRA